MCFVVDYIISSKGLAIIHTHHIHPSHWKSFVGLWMKWLSKGKFLKYLVLTFRDDDKKCCLCSCCRSCEDSFDTFGKTAFFIHDKSNFPTTTTELSELIIFKRSRTIRNISSFWGSRHTSTLFKYYDNLTFFSRGFLLANQGKLLRKLKLPWPCQKIVKLS